MHALFMFCKNGVKQKLNKIYSMMCGVDFWININLYFFQHRYFEI
jgi:hypothetical protein